MAKFRTMKTSFVGGEISSSASARVDMQQYPHACKIMRNMIPFPSGGGYARPGTFFETSFDATIDYAPHLIPFVVSPTEAYALWIERVIGGNTVMGGKRPTSNTSTSTSVSISGTLPYLPAKIATTTTVGYYDEWRNVKYAQSVDVLTMLHPSYKVQRLYRTATDTFRVTEFDHDNSGTRFSGTSLREAWPYLPESTTGVTLAISAATVGTGRTVTASAPFFDPKHVGAVFKSFDGTATYGCFLVTGYTDSTHVTVEVIVALGTTGARATWWESAWSDYRGWPRAVGFYKNRIVYAGTKNNPDSLWFSKIYNYDTLSVMATVDPRSETDNSNPFTLELESSQLNLIQWIAPDKTLVTGTSVDEFVIQPDPNSTTTGFGCVNVIASRQSSFGSAYFQPVRESNEILVCAPNGAEIKALIFNLIENAYHDEPVQLLYDEVPHAESQALSAGQRLYRQYGWDRSRRINWACDTAGNLFGMTRDPRIQFTAWHSHQMGGYDATKTGGRPETTAIDPIGGMCSGSVCSVAVVPNPILGTDDVWLVVKRYINASYSYHIERMIGSRVPYESAYTVRPTGEGIYLVDAAVYNTNDFPLTEDFVFGGLNHLIGQTPVGTAFSTSGIFKVTGSAVDGSGNTTLQKTYPTGISTESISVVFGLAYTPLLVPVRPEAGSQIGTSQGAVKRIHESDIRFWRTMCARVGYYQDTLGGSIKSFPVNFHNPSTAMGKSVELFTGEKRVKVEGDYDRDAYMALYTDQPLPFAVLGISMEGLTYD